MEAVEKERIGKNRNEQGKDMERYVERYGENMNRVRVRNEEVKEMKRGT